MSTVAAARTYPGKPWLRTRYAALVRAVERSGVPFERALAIARTYLALWILETGWGRGESNFNPGNLHRGSRWTGDVYVAGDGGADVAFRAYPSIDAAADDFVRLVSHGVYAPAWVQILEHPDDPAAWLPLLLTPPNGAAGYHPPHGGDVDELLGVLDLLPRRTRAAAR